MFIFNGDCLIYCIKISILQYSSTPIGAWKWNFPPCKEIIKDRPTTNWPTEGETAGHCNKLMFSFAEWSTHLDLRWTGMTIWHVFSAIEMSSIEETKRIYVKINKFRNKERIGVTFLVFLYYFYFPFSKRFKRLNLYCTLDKKRKLYWGRF